MPPSIILKDVGKRFYRRTPTPSIIRRMLGLERVTRVEVWPFRHVDLELEAGSATGIVGRNGCGKTTLLSLIAGALQPTDGEVLVRGRVSALLSLGIGFMPDMTGREAIKINGVVSGMSLAEIAARTADIVAFAELEEVIDTPVRFYSSGMRARLGFSVAMHAEPDVALIDEALAVGDAAFRKKCIDRLRALHERQATVVLVSHDATILEALCSRVVWLEGGRVRADGEARAVLADYRAFMNTQ